MSVALVVQHVEIMRRIILPPLACLASSYFSILRHKRYDFRKNVIEHIMYVLIFSTICLQHLLHEELSEIWSKTYTGIHVKYQLFLSDFNELEFSRHFFKKYSSIKFHENPSSKVELYHADGRTEGQTDVTRLLVAFRNFASAPKPYKLKYGFQKPSVCIIKTMGLHVYVYTFTDVRPGLKFRSIKIHMHIWDFTMGAVQMIVVFWILTPCTKNLLTPTMTENGVPFKSSGVTITTNRTALSFLNIS